MLALFAVAAAALFAWRAFFEVASFCTGLATLGILLGTTSLFLPATGFRALLILLTLARACRLRPARPWSLSAASEPCPLLDACSRGVDPNCQSVVSLPITTPGRGRTRQHNITSPIMMSPQASQTPAISNGISSRRCRRYLRSPRKLVASSTANAAAT